MTPPISMEAGGPASRISPNCSKPRKEEMRLSVKPVLRLS